MILFTFTLAGSKSDAKHMIRTKNNRCLIPIWNGMTYNVQWHSDLKQTCKYVNKVWLINTTPCVCYPSLCFYFWLVFFGVVEEFWKLFIFSQNRYWHFFGICFKCVIKCACVVRFSWYCWFYWHAASEIAANN